MFYSHEVLNSRKYGVATIWLVATLGQKSTLRRVTRKQILEVNVAKACQNIVTSEAPLALRLQSTLLYGVSRVYDQQCGYVLSDAQHAQNSMRNLFHTVRTAELDPESSRARPDQLLLQDDPAFLPNFDLVPVDLSLEDYLAHALEDSQFSMFSLSGSNLSQQSGAGPNLNFPSDTSHAPGFDLAPESATSLSFPGRLEILAPEEELLPDVGFEIDDQGNVIELAMESTAPGVEETVARVNTSIEAHQEAQKEHTEGHIFQAPVSGPQSITIDVPTGHGPQDEGLVLSISEFPVTSSPTIFPSSEAEPSSSASARLRKRHRAPRVILTDTTIELRNRDLLGWSSNYAKNMNSAISTALRHRAPQQAKKNAEYWILGAGINGVGSGIGASKAKSPLDAFAGGSLYKMLIRDSRPSALTTTSQKRGRELSDDEHVEDDRRTRLRVEEQQDHVSRGMLLDEETAFLGPRDEPELPRQGGVALEDVSTTMPWNMSGSIRGSSLGHSKAQSLVGAPQLSSSAARRGRILSASPLAGRGRSGGVLGPEALIGYAGGLSSEAMPLDEFDTALSFGARVQDDGLMAPVAADTQAFPRQRAALDKESDNFLAFIEQHIEANRAGAVAAGSSIAATAAQDTNVVGFEDLLPPGTTSRVVAAQALLHVLSLVTKQLICAKQKEAYGTIEIRPIETVAEA